MSTKCSQCSHELHKDALFCSKCGQKVIKVTCSQCGKALPAEAKFCVYCGQVVGAEPAESTTTATQSTTADEPVVAKAVLTTPMRPAPQREVVRREDGDRRQAPEEDARTHQNLSAYAEKNQSYFHNQFERIARGEDGSFNWCAFFFGPLYCLYRNTIGLFLRFYKIYLIFWALNIVLSLAIPYYYTVTQGAVGLAASVSVTSIISVVIGIYGLICNILAGKNFNRGYYDHCVEMSHRHPSVGAEKGTSTKKLLIGIAVIVAISILSGVLSTTLNKQAVLKYIDETMATPPPDYFVSGSSVTTVPEETTAVEEVVGEEPTAEFSDFVGSYVSLGDDPYDMYSETIGINMNGSAMGFESYGYRTVYIDYMQVAISDITKTGSTIEVAVFSSWINKTYSVRIMFESQEDSPYGVDTLYVESDYLNGTFTKYEYSSTWAYEEPVTIQDSYLLPSNTRYLTISDLYGFTAEEAALARNEIYARYGYNFTNATYQAYFNAQSWYQSVAGLDSSTFSSSMFNAYELANIDVIKEYEAMLPQG